MELLMRDTRALRDERRIDRDMARKFWCATATGYVLGFLSVTRRDFLPFLNLNFGTMAS